MSPRQWKRVTRELGRMLALTFALAVVTATLLGGHRYFYCAPMARIALDECCAAEHEHEPELREQAAEAVLDALPHRCCQERTFDCGDQGASPSRATLGPPGESAPVAILPLASMAALAARSARGWEAHPTRGPPRAGPAGPLRWRTPIDVSLS